MARRDQLAELRGSACLAEWRPAVCAAALLITVKTRSPTSLEQRDERIGRTDGQRDRHDCPCGVCLIFGFIYCFIAGIVVRVCVGRLHLCVCASVC